MSVPTARQPADLLASWNDTPTRAAIVEFVERVTDEDGAHLVPPDDRVAVFDNDGTLWCEGPCRSRWASSSCAWPRWRRPTSRSAKGSRGRQRARRTTRGSVR